ncbi:protein phosphatase 1 regulatory subunit 12C [Tachyglossus aculeatus]|uniref:protein phosphatase 1 regulatory subunit 12C n=1 Tax=Tachyglossus aculeatus TaxID=9261 RepID=UPI0018F4B538|nr:protein phosphatase 1 regulatory subunit 12C [Tachyglossus aculeatus]
MLRGDAPGPPGPPLLDRTNADGISALHQACIDENLEVVRFLVEQGATVNQADNEGWTPLHVAASCGYTDIAQYLLSHGADIAAVNSDGDLPLDLAEADAMESLLRAEVARRGVDIGAAKRAEEELLLQDTRRWLDGGAMPDPHHPRTGASALHVAAAKGYIEVMRLLLQAGYDPNVRDRDGWTPLHAAAHWGVEEACRLLVEHAGDMDTLNNVGQRPCDLADEDVLTLLEELQKKQEDLRNQKEACQGRVTEPQPIYSSKHRRSSVCRMSSKEKISVQDLSKERKPPPGGGPGETPAIRDEDSGDEGGGAGEPPPHRPSALNGVSSPLLGPPSPLSSTAPARPAEPGGPWRSGLRKTGSSGALGPSGWQRQEPPELGPQRSASSSRLEGGERNQEPRLARVPPTPSRRMVSLPESRLPVPPPQTVDTSDPPAPSIVPSDSRDRRRSYQTPVRDEESESQRKARSRLMRQSRRSTQGVTLTDLKEAEKTLGRSVEPEKGEPPPADNPDTARLSRVPGVDGSDSVGPFLEAPAQREEPEGEGGWNRLSDRRKARKERRGLAEGEEEPVEPPNSERSPQPSSPPASRSLEPDQPDSGFRKLYEGLQAENATLRETLQETQLRLTQLKVELERATQRQERHAERPALLELERFERRALERKAVELEEELKALSDLRADNQRLKDENAALIRVISKLSK